MKGVAETYVVQLLITPVSHRAVT